MSEETIDEKDTRSWWRKLLDMEALHIMQAGTIVWLLLLAVFMAWTQQCPWQWDVAWYRVDLRYFSCRTSNELGDFLAGAFAPLAFLWLAGAVFIQARELKEQRQVLVLQQEELELTREEMELSRGVMTQQAKEAKASTKFIGEQTAILTAQQSERERDLADNEFEELLISVVEAARSIETMEFSYPNTQNRHGHIPSLVAFEIFENQSTADLFKVLCDMRNRLEKQAANEDCFPVGILKVNNEIIMTVEDPRYVERLLTNAVELVEIEPRLSYEGKKKFERLRCKEACTTYIEVLKDIAPGFPAD